MKQTAVDWLVKELECYGDPDCLKMGWGTLDELIKQAKEMEKEQIENAYDYGFANGYDDGLYDDEPTYIDSQDYYNKTYNN